MATRDAPVTRAVRGGGMPGAGATLVPANQRDRWGISETAGAASRGGSGNGADADVEVETQ